MKKKKIIINYENDDNVSYFSMLLDDAVVVFEFVNIFSAFFAS